MDILDILRSCVTGMIPVTLITIAGAYLTHTKVFNKSSNDLISLSSTRLFIPLFMLIALSKASNIDNLPTLLLLIGIQALFIIMTIGISFLFIPFVKPPVGFKYTTILIFAFSNVGNIPLLILQGFCASYGPFAGDDQCEYNVGYISMVCFSFNILVWTIGPALAKLDKEEKAKIENTQMEHIPLRNLILRGLNSPIPKMCLAGFLMGLIPGYH